MSEDAIDLVERADARTAQAVRAVIDAGARAAARNWVPATSGNFSVRVDARRVAITATGTDKGALGEEDVLVVDPGGHPHPRASAESALHFAIYQTVATAGAVLHVHSQNAVLASLALVKNGRVNLKGLELLKAFHGIRTHHAEVVVPVYPNSQNMTALAERVVADLTRRGEGHGFLLKGHGIYAWGRTETEAWRHLETFDYLFALQLELRRLKS